MKTTKSVRISTLQRGTFFMFDPNGDVLCRFLSIKRGTAFYNAIGSTSSVPLSSDAKEAVVYLVDDVPAEYTETLKQEFIATMKQRIFKNLNMWEVGILVSLLNGQQPPFSDLLDQQKDNASLMQEMIGYEAANIISNLKL